MRILLQKKKIIIYAKPRNIIEVCLCFQDASKKDQIEGVVKYVKRQMAEDRKVGALKQLQGLVWSQGYDRGDIKGQ